MKKILFLFVLLILAQSVIQAATKRTLTFTKEGAGSGRIRIQGALQYLPYSVRFDDGLVVQVIAVPDAATSTFVGWSGDVTSTAASINISVNSDKNITATFSLIKRTLTLSSTGTGTGAAKVNDTLRTLPYTGLFDHGTNVKLEAVPDAGNIFTGWGGVLSGTTNPVNITMNSSNSVTADFTLQRALSITRLGTGTGQVKVNGTLQDLPYTGTFAPNSVVNLEAVPDAASGSFTAWGGDLSGNANPVNITMSSNKTVTAAFTLLNRSLMVPQNTGTGSGQMKVNDTLRTLPYSASYPHGTTVKLEAVPDVSSSSFTGWGGDLSGTTNPVNITMTSNKTVSAQFTLLSRQLMVLENTGTGSGQVKVNDTVRTLPYSASYSHGTVVKLEAIPDPAASSFSGWGGDLSGTANPVNVTMTSNKTVSAAFTLLNRGLLVLQSTGTGSGNVKVNDTLRTLPYTASYPHGTVVKLEAIPDAAISSFTGWGSDLKGTSTSVVNITMTSDRSVNAIFTLLNRSLMVIQNTGTGTGAVKVNDTLRVLPYTASYPHGTVVKLEAAADASTSSFTGWSGSITGTANPVNITMEGDKTLSAEFTLINRSLMVLENTGTGSGLVKVNDTTRALPYSASYPHGTLVKLEAVADASTSSFSGLSGDFSGTTNPVTITMNSNKTLSASFTLLNRSLMVLQNTGTGSGQVKVNDTVRTLPYSASYSHGTVVKLEAVPDGSTSSFTGWGGDVSGNTNPVNVTMNSNKTVSAQFTLLRRSLMVLQNTGTGSGKIKVNDTLRTLPFTASYPHGTTVKLEAVSDNAASIFTGWGSGLSGKVNPVNIPMNQDKSICAEFTINQFTLKINSAGSGDGQIMVNDIIVKLPYENVFICGTNVLIKVIPFEGSRFDGWSGSITGKDNPLSVKVDSNTTLTASLNILQKNLTITQKGTGTGQVRVNDELKTLPYEGSFDYNEVVTLQAVPSEGSIFTSWGGDIAGTCNNPASVKMTSDKNVTAEFTALPDAPLICSPVDQCGLVTINPVLKWKEVKTATAYNVQVSTDKCFKLLVVDETVTSTCKQTGPLNYNTCYYWRVRAGNCAGIGKFSGAAVFKTEKQPVKAPCNLIAKAEYGKIRLLWSDSSDNESGFFVFRKDGDIASANIYQLLGKVDRNNTVFIDSTIKVNVAYTYKVSAFTSDSVVSFSNEFTITNTLLAVEENGSIPTDYKLYQNYPNPFNPSTVIRYFLQNDSHVKLTVFNSLGKEVTVLVNEFRQSGMNTVTFNASDISAGVYFYRIETLEEGGKRYLDVKKLVLMK